MSNSGGMANGKKEQKPVKLEIELPTGKVSVNNPPPAKTREVTPTISEEPTIAGYKPEDILISPIEKPRPVDKRPPTIHQKRMMMVGLLIVFASLVVGVLAGAIAGISIALSGAFVIAVSVLIRI